MIKKVEWLSNMKGLNLYGVGGSFRALGAIYHKTKYPLGMLHALTMSKIAANSILNQILDEKPDLEGIPEDVVFQCPKHQKL